MIFYAAAARIFFSQQDNIKLKRCIGKDANEKSNRHILCVTINEDFFIVIVNKQVV